MILNPIQPSPDKSRPAFSDDIIDAILEELTVTRQEFYSNGRIRRIVDARIVVSHILRLHPNIQIGIKDTARLIHKDHAMIIWYLKRCNNAERFDDVLYQKLRACHYRVFGHLIFLTDYYYTPNYNKRQLMVPRPAIV